MGIESLTASERAPYHLLCQGAEGMERDPDLEVVEWHGQEEISAPYSYRITVAVADAERNMDELLQRRVTLQADYDKDTVYFPGVVDRVRRTGRHDERLLYQLEVVPLLRSATEHQYQTRIFQNQTVEQIATEILQEGHGFVLDQDFRFDLQEQYEEIDFKVQYHESDLAFIHRLCEREGIFYFFEHGEEREVVCFFDHASKYFDRTQTRYRLRPSEGGVPEEEEVLDDLSCTSTTVPERIVIVDYNYRRENLPLDTEEVVQAPRTHGVHYEYGLHFKTKAEGKRLGRILAEGFLARSRVLHGDSTIRNLRSGHAYDFHLYEGEEDPLDGQYVITSVQHEGDQSEAVFGEQEREGSASYRNGFEAMPSDRVFRPERVTPHPRVSGFLTGVVESAGGDHPDVDEEGRYVVRLHYDLSGRERAKATKRIRMMQPHGGAREGHHFPLHEGTEVAIMCMDGDPDRPVIAGVLPNPSTRSPVTSDNNSNNLILTRSGNTVHLADKEGLEKVRLHTPKEESSLRLGAAAGAGEDEGPDGVLLQTRGEMLGKAQEGITLEGPPKVCVKSEGSDGYTEVTAQSVIRLIVPNVGTIHIDGDSTYVSFKDSYVKLEADKITASSKKVEVTGSEQVEIKGNSAGVKITGTPDINLN